MSPVTPSVAVEGADGTVSTAVLLGCIDAAITAGAAEGHTLAVAVVDAGAHPLAFGRHRESRLITFTTALGKARCAALFARSTRETVRIASANPLAFGTFAGANELPFVISDGGLYLRLGDAQFGIGVAGAANGADHEVAVSIVAPCFGAVTSPTPDDSEENP